ncbi:hypothetical protein ACOMD4_16590 [Streptomyces anulatus]|uniref:hypothetical protein n=1 Tax=Streptomyces anulatus TaxID=1892 RepID=UPI003B7637B6
MKGSYAVYLNEVEQAASAHPQILEAAAPALRLADSTEDIGCVVRLVEGGDVSADDVLAHLREAPGAQRAPCRVVLTDAPLPRGGQDKLERPSVVARWDALPGASLALPSSATRWRWRPASRASATGTRRCRSPRSQGRAASGRKSYGTGVRPAGRARTGRCSAALSRTGTRTRNRRRGSRW